MARLVLVRHGRAAGGWDDDLDPGLDDVGRAQALGVAEVIGCEGPRPIVTSPLRRCRETATPLAARWGVDPTMDDAVGEIPSPPGVPLGQRVPWLREAMAGTWAQLGPVYTGWRDAVVARLLAFNVDTVVFSHFVAINAVLGAANGDDRLVIRSLDNCSRTLIHTEGGQLVVLQAGHEADTLIL
jgi:broad specificity phosphatase PhoE